MSTNTDPTPAPQVTASSDIQLAAARVAELAAEHGMLEHVPSWLSRGLSRDQVAAEILARKAETAKPAPSPAGHVDLSAREQKQYSVARAIAAQAAGTWARGSLEAEVSEAIAKRSGKEAQGFFVPLNMRAGTAQTVATAADGGNTVENSVVEFIDLLRNKMQVRALGAQVLTGLTSNLIMPRQITASTAVWTGENPSAVTASKFTTDTVTLSPKTLLANVPLSRNLVVQSSFDAEALVRDDLAQVVALALDLAALHGTGASNQPRGIAATSGISIMTGATNGAALTWDAVVAAESAVSAANADLGTMAYLFTPEVYGKLKTTVKAGTFPVFILEDGMVNGYRTERSSQLLKNLTKGTGTNLHAGFFGAWSQLVLGEFGGAMDIVVDPYSRKNEGLLDITAFAMFDVAIKQPKAFSYFNDIIAV